jgi:hypothetical protein
MLDCDFIGASLTHTLQIISIVILSLRFYLGEESSAMRQKVWILRYAQNAGVKIKGALTAPLL